MGPPPVMIYTWVKIMNEEIVPINRLKNVIGDSIGNVILKNRWIADAPSMIAASYRYPGICFRPARKITISDPNCQTLSRIKTAMAVEGLPTQLGPSIPNRARKELIGPSSANRFLQPMAAPTLVPIREGR